MKKLLLLTLILLFVCLVTTLTSCYVEEELRVDITKNGGSVVQEQVIDKSTYDSLISMGADVDSVEENGGKISFFTRDGVEYAKISFSKDFNSLKDLSNYLGNLGEADNGAYTDIADRYFDQLSISYNESDKTISFKGKIGDQSDLSAYTSCKLILNFPGKVLEYNIGKKTDKNTVEIDLLELWEDYPGYEFEIVAKGNNYTIVIIICAIVLGLAIVIIGAYIIIKKNKNAKAKKIAETQNEFFLEQQAPDQPQEQSLEQPQEQTPEQTPEQQ